MDKDHEVGEGAAGVVPEEFQEVEEFSININIFAQKNICKEKSK